MPHRLVDVAKVGCFCDAIQHSTEKRKDGEVKVVQLTLRVQPFDSKLAGAVRQDVRQTLFKLNSPNDPQAHLARVNFALGVPRQNLHLFASRDTVKASLLLDHVKISNVYARTESNVNGYALVFKATFGPASSRELEYAEDWRNGQRFVTFEEAEASLEFDEEAEEEADDDAPERPREMWDEGDEQNPNAAAASAPAAEPEAARHNKPRHADKKSAAKAKQAAGKKR